MKIFDQFNKKKYDNCLNIMKKLIILYLDEIYFKLYRINWSFELVIVKKWLSFTLDLMQESEFLSLQINLQGVKSSKKTRKG